jgi:glycerol uptake facilitator-like aquaporin
LTRRARGSFSLIGLGFIGFAFIIFSQTGEIGKLGETGVSHLAIGLALALGAMALSNLKAFGIDWARDLGNQLSESLRGLGSDPPYSL